MSGGTAALPSNGLLGAHFHTGVCKAALTQVGHLDQLFGAAVAGKLDHVDQRGIVVLIGDGGIELGRAEIDYSKCVSCGQCLVNCPFGAIADKGQIYQLIQGFNRGDRIYALVAPAFINQFPSLASTGKLNLMHFS